MAYRLISRKSKKGKTCHQDWYGFKHVIFELLQLRSLITIGLTVALIYAILHVETGRWDIVAGTLTPITTMALTSLFRKEKDE